jgi:hypothetical protein
MYKVKITSTKPSGVKWFNQENQVKFEELNSWVKALPGLINIKKLVGQSTENVSVKLFTFTDETAYANFIREHDINPLEAERRSYNEANGITIIKEIV